MFGARLFSGGLEKSRVQITLKDESSAHLVNFQWLETEDAENVVTRLCSYLSQALADRRSCGTSSGLSTVLKVIKLSSNPQSSDHDILAHIIDILRQHNLEELSYSNTGPYISTSHSFVSMETLLRLNLANSGLSELPAGLLALTCLQSLEISQNKIASLAPGIGQLVRLEALWVDENLLASVPGAVPATNLLQRRHLLLQKRWHTFKQCSALQRVCSSTSFMFTCCSISTSTLVRSSSYPPQILHLHPCRGDL
jgi:hypothetical protein